jgi:phosphotransferase system enzyme I (PtsP)
LGEECYESFLGVPILRGQKRIGAMVIQNIQKDSFNDEDIKAFRAVTSQLANTIETAKILMGIKEEHRPREEEPLPRELKLIKGRVASEGLVLAEAAILEDQIASSHFREAAASQQYTVEDFHRAVQTTGEQLEDLQRRIEEDYSDTASMIFAAQILMLKDESFINLILNRIRDKTHPAQAIVEVTEAYAQRFEGLPNAYLREKRHDIQDVGWRLLENLIGITDEHHDYSGKLVIARELYPSDIFKLLSQSVRGIILLSGGITSHLSILARSLDIPMVITETHQLLRLPPKTRIFLDAEHGNIYLDPSAEVIEFFHKTQEDREHVRKLEKECKDKTETKDGKRVTLLANINLLCDLKAAHAFKAEGIGLYRSEFPFMTRIDFPTEEEQYVIYKKMVTSMPGKEVTFRTLDIGGDKILSYYDYGNEENPFLGMRSIRFSLKHKEIFGQQLRAILRAGVGADLKIMFPMISSLDEFLEAKEVVMESIGALREEGVACHEAPDIGMMVELPAVLEIINELAEEVDFFSIGTNDFVQYMLAVDRTNEKVADLYLPQHPSILRALKKVVDAANSRQKDVSICGDMAYDARYIPYLLGIGIRKFSLNSRYLPKVQHLIENTDTANAEAKTKQYLKCGKISDTSKMIV